MGLQLPGEALHPVCSHQKAVCFPWLLQSCPPAHRSTSPVAGGPSRCAGVCACAQTCAGCGACVRCWLGAGVCSVPERASPREVITTLGIVPKR